MVDLARKNLLHDKLRFLITVFGVAFAVMLMFVQVGLFLGLLKSSTITIEKLGADLWVTSKNTPNVDFSHAFPETRINRVRSIPGVARADNLIVVYLNVKLPTGAEDAVLTYALEDFAAWKFPWRVLEGDPEELRRGDYILLDESSIKRFGSFQTGEYREVMGNRLKIIGRTTEARSFTTTPIVFMDYSLAQRVGSRDYSDQTSYILIKLKPGTDVERVRAEIQQRLPHNDVYTSTEWAKRSRDYWVVSTGLGFNLMLTVFLGCLVGVVIVAQTLYTSTMEHLKEFGTVKAIGGGNADIYRVLAKQAAISAVVGFVLGLLPALALRPLVASMGLELVITPQIILITFVGTLVLCLSSAMLSFHKVARIDPALVFRT
jgi:putative ABC transport system permease protein